MRFLIILFCCALQVQLHAQEKLITLKAGEDISALYKHVYRYPGFTKGKVNLTNGDSISVLLNYNLFEGAVQFIDKKDTLLIAEKESIRDIVISDDTFFREGTHFLRFIDDYGFTKLAVEDKLILHDEQRIGAMGMARPTHNIDSKSTFTSWQTLGLQLNRDLIFSKEQRFYFLQDGVFHPVTKKALNKLFSFAGKKSLQEYEHIQKPDLDTETGLRDLFTYMSSVWKSMNK